MKTLLAQRLGRREVVSSAHFWAILGIVSCGTAWYCSDYIPGLDRVVEGIPLQISRYSTHCILSLLPIAYAAYVFRLRGGLVATILITLMLLPRLLISDEREEPLTEAAAFLFIGSFVRWMSTPARPHESAPRRVPAAWSRLTPNCSSASARCAITSASLPRSTL